MLTIMYNARSLHWFICRNFSGLFFPSVWFNTSLKGDVPLNKRAVWFSGSVYFLLSPPSWSAGLKLPMLPQVAPAPGKPVGH